MANKEGMVAADPEVVFEIYDNLRRHFESILEGRREAGGDTDFLDAFMAAHNFHKGIVADICEKVSPGSRAIWLTMARDTWDHAMAELLAHPEKFQDRRNELDGED